MTKQANATRTNCREVIPILKRAAIGDVVVGLESRRERLHGWRAGRCPAWACLSYYLLVILKVVV
jgi:hypothetical protein